MHDTMHIQSDSVQNHSEYDISTINPDNDELKTLTFHNLVGNLQAFNYIESLIRVGYIPFKILDIIALFDSNNEKHKYFVLHSILDGINKL